MPQVDPKLDNVISPVEKYYGFLLSKSLIKYVDVSMCTKIQAFGDIICTNPLVTFISG